MTVLTPPQIATRWRCKPDTVRQLLETGQLPGFTISPPGTRRPHWRVTLDAVIAYESGEVQPTAVPIRRNRQRQQRTQIPQGPF